MTAGYRANRRLLVFRVLAMLDKLRPSRGVPIALYHQITNTPAGKRIGGHVTPGAFRQQMHRLAKRGYRGISVREHLALQRDSQSLAEKVMVLTFDDGQEDVHASAFPVLKALGFSATVFLVTEYIGREKWFDPHTDTWSDCRPHQQALYYRFMDWDQIGEMHAAGFEFGAHTRTHPRLIDLVRGEAQQEIEGSKATVERVLGVRVDTFCYPFGCFNDSVRQMVIKTGYQAACSTVHGLNGPDTDPFALRRYGIAAITGPAFDVYLTDKYAWYYRNSRRWRGNT